MNAPKPEPTLPSPAERRVIEGIHHRDGQLNYPAIRALVASARRRGWIREPADTIPWSWGWR